MYAHVCVRACASLNESISFFFFIHFCTTPWLRWCNWRTFPIDFELIQLQLYISFIFRLQPVDTDLKRRKTCSVSLKFIYLFVHFNWSVVLLHSARERERGSERENQCFHKQFIFCYLIIKWSFWTPLEEWRIAHSTDCQLNVLKSSWTSVVAFVHVCCIFTAKKCQTKSIRISSLYL